MELTQVARKYKEKGLSPIPINEKKQPMFNWQKYQNKFITDPEIDEEFKNAAAIGIVCGNISGGTPGFSLCVVDMDCKYFDDNITYKEVLLSIPKDIRNKLLISTTRSGGYHLYFRTPVHGKNRKFAMRETTEEERKEHPTEKVKVLIENRHEGGMVVATPSEGYNVVSKVKQIPYITEEEHHIIFDAMSTFNRVINEQECYEKFTEEKKNKFLQSPFDSANERMNVLSLLQAHGYVTVGKKSGDEIKLKRGGSTNSTHSGYYKESKNKYVNFSTSGLLDSGKSYGAAELYCLLECNGNWSMAYKRLLEEGYGISVDIGQKVREFVKAFRDGNLEKLLEMQFSAQKTFDGKFNINGQFFNIK